MSNDFVVSAKLIADTKSFKGEISGAKNELNKLNKTTVDANGRLRDASGKFAKMGNEANQAAKEVLGLNRNTQTLTGGFGALKAALASLGIGLLIRDILQVGSAFEGIESTLLSVAGSSEAVKTEFGFIAKEADRLGLRLTSTAKAYAQVAAAAKGTALQGQPARDIFTSVSEAMTVLNKSAADTEGALTAINQIISKGKVQAEELRGQLGERVPGAFQIAARAMGVTTMQLDKMLEQGQVMAEDFLPKFAVELRKTFADALPSATNRARSEWNRFLNAVDSRKSTVFTGMAPALALELKEVTELLNGSQFDQAAEAIGSTLGGAVHLASEALQFLVENSDAALAVLGGFATLKTASTLVSIAGGAKAATVALLAMSATPVGAIGLALGTATAALIYFRNEAVTVGQQTATVTDFVVGAWEYVSESIAGAWGMAEEFADGPWAQATFETLQKVVGWYKEMYNTAIAVFASIGDVAVIGADGVADAFDNAFDFIMEGFSDIGGAAKLLFSGDFEEAGQLASNALNRSFESGLSETGQKIQNSVSENFNKDWLGDWMGAVWQGADELAGGVIDDVAARAAQRYQSRLADLDPGTAPTTQSTGIPDAPANKSAQTRTSKQIKDHENAVKKIRKAYIELLPQQERVAEQAKMWREDAMKGLDPLGKGYKEMKAHLDEIYDDMILQGSTDWDAGFVRGFKTIAEEASDTASHVETAMGKAFSGAEDYLVGLATRTKASFSDMTQSILMDIARILIRQQVIAPMATAAGSAFSMMFSAKGNAFGPQGVQMFAQGSAFSNSIVSTPTMFQFGGGQLGVMAENDPEAVMPLFRTPSGDLGVKTSGMGGGGGLYVQVIDQRTNAQDSEPIGVEAMEGPGGVEGAKIFVRDTTKTDLAKGRYDNTFKDRFGFGPKARRR